MNKIYNLLSKYDQNKEIVTLCLLDRFEPLLNKYSKNTYYSDMKNDLVLFFIELIPKIPIYKENFKHDKYIISYIHKSLKNQYILLNKKYNKNLKMEESFNSKNYLFAIANETYNDIEVRSIVKNLTLKEKQVIIYKYQYNLSFAFIGKIMNVSRQSIYKTHKRAINKLRRAVLNK